MPAVHQQWAQVGHPYLHKMLHACDLVPVRLDTPGDRDHASTALTF